MQAFVNSPNKERIRLSHQQDAKNREDAIRVEASSKVYDVRQQENYIRADGSRQINEIKRKNRFLTESRGKVTGIGCGAGLILGAMFGSSAIMGGIIIGGVVGFVISTSVRSSCKEQEKSILANVERQVASCEQQVNSILADCDRQVMNAYQQADERTRTAVDRYDRQVKEAANRALAKREQLKPMIDRNVMMFERMIGHSDSRAHIRFVETAFTFTVDRKGIRYSYKSQYNNTRDDFVFDVERFRDLGSDEECEGLARALTQLTSDEIKRIHAKDNPTITKSHVDAAVTLNYKGVNANFVPSTGIF